jgi:diguanylate cyclase (GGDEF)-like protein/PAS domain S-box-containing protein
MTSQDRLGEDNRRAILGLTLAALMALVTWLFLQADRGSPEEHYRYMQALRRTQQADVELNAAVVASYADILQNYDPMVRHIEEIRRQRASIVDLPMSLPASYRERLAKQVKALVAAQQLKEDEVDRFQRGNSVLRNSEFYFPQAAESLLRQVSVRGNADFERFVRQMLAFGRGANLPGDESMRAQMARLSQLELPVAAPLSIAQLLVHAELIVERRPQVNALVQQIMRSSTTSLLEELTGTYVEGYEEALHRADQYRQWLYVVSMLLVAHAVYALLRVERGRRKLAAALVDLAERYAAQQRAEANLRLYGTVFTHATEGMMITDAEARIVAVNPAFCTITGYTASEVLGHTPAMLRSTEHDQAFYSEMRRSLTDHGHWQGEIWNRRKNGEVYPEWLSVAAVRGVDGLLTHHIGVFTDTSERKRNEARIQHLAYHDALTGLPNRLLMEDRMGQALLKAKRCNCAMAVNFIDLDRFKNINDTLGHAIGDELLAQAAARSLSALRGSDTLARQGGDEFVVVLPELERSQDVVPVARKLLGVLRQPYQLAGHALTVTASAGIALYPEDGETVSDLLRKAAAATYRAKEEGCNTFRFFSAETNTASLGDLLLEHDLYGAQERGELLMLYQPKVAAGSGELVGAEALMRWNHRQQGMISPARFIPLAEGNGLISAFSDWAIRNVCAQQRAWIDAGLAAVPVAVNISAQHFARNDLPAMVAKVLDEYALPPQLLQLELTESLLMRNASQAAAVLQTLHDMHVETAIDDFGTGYSSLAYLNQFRIHALKIDRSFVCQIGEQGETTRLAAAIIAMAHELKLEVVAEGVETEAQRDYLVKHGCDQLQGYLFGRPQPAEELARRMFGKVPERVPS